MKFVGVDLHKHSIKLCVLVVLGGNARSFLGGALHVRSPRPSGRFSRNWETFAWSWITAVKCKIRNKAAQYHADIAEKKAIVAVARHLLCTMFSMLQAGKAYRYAASS